MKRLLPLAAAGALLSSLAACTPSVTPTSPTIIATGPTAPTVVCTPIGSTTATPCTQQQYDQLQQQLADYADAEKVYRQFAEADARLVSAGALADDETLSLLTQPMRDSYVAARQKQHDRGLTGVGTFRVAYVRPLPSLASDGFDAVLESCVDASEVVASENGKNLGKGKAAHDTTFLSRVRGVMKIARQTTEVQDRC